jgi:hypothetical protein
MPKAPKIEKRYKVHGAGFTGKNVKKRSLTAKEVSELEI